MKIMKLLYGLVAIGLFSQILACKNTVKKSATDIIYNIDADKTQNLIDLKLSSIADSFRLVPLETREDCLLDNHTEYYIGDCYILAYCENGVYKFSADGKFIKKLFIKGRGPNEFFGLVGFCTFVVDSKKNYLYIYDQTRRNVFLVYDILSECFLESVKKHIPGYGFFAIYSDSALIVANSDYFDSSKYAVHIQNLKGELITGINHNKKIIYNQTEISQPSSLTIGDSSYHVSFIRDDTLFKLRENKLVPYLALNFNLPRDNPPSRTRKKGDRIIIFPRVEAPNFIIIQIDIIDEMVWYSTGTGDDKIKRNYLFFNKSSGKAARINTYTDNFIGETQDIFKLSQVIDGGYLKFPTILPNRLFVVAYYPYQIKEAIKKGLNYEDFPDSLNNQLNKINETMKEMDNPILLVGILKKKS
jgi:hypothetical protein